MEGLHNVTGFLHADIEEAPAAVADEKQPAAPTVKTTRGRKPAANLTHGMFSDFMGVLVTSGHYSMAAGFAAEVLMTFIFLMVIFWVTSKNAEKGFAGLAIGLTLLLLHMPGIAVTGISVNPARSLGPALFVGGTALSQLWLFIVAPVIGALIAAATWTYLFEARPVSP